MALIKTDRGRGIEFAVAQLVLQEPLNFVALSGINPRELVLPLPSYIASVPIASELTQHGSIVSMADDEPLMFSTPGAYMVNIGGVFTNGTDAPLYVMTGVGETQVLGLVTQPKGPAIEHYLVHAPAGSVGMTFAASFLVEVSAADVAANRGVHIFLYAPSAPSTGTATFGDNTYIQITRLGASFDTGDSLLDHWNTVMY